MTCIENRVVYLVIEGSPSLCASLSVERLSFATYTRDSFSGLDYAVNRWHLPGMGRFGSADPYQASAGPGDPGSWNRYSYVRGNPVNSLDHLGLMDEEDWEDTGNGETCGVDWMNNASLSGPCVLDNTGIVAPVQTTTDSSEESWKCPQQYEDYIDSYGSYAAATGLSEANVLALSSIESSWGQGRFATEGHSFFNFETGWTLGTKLPGFLVKYQTGWIQAKLPYEVTKGKDNTTITKYALVATFATDSDSFKSFAASPVGNALRGVNDAKQFGQIAERGKIHAGSSPAFLGRAATFARCLGQ